MSPAGEKVPVDIEGRRLTLSNLQKVLYPETGFAKAQVIDYYTRVAPVLLPHLRDRPLTRKRYPNGVDGGSFFEKNAPSHHPDWVRTATIASPGSTRNRETIDYVVCDDLPTLVWLANLAALELHTPMWRVSTGLPDMMVVDLDPGAPATIVECCRVARLVRDATDVEWFAKTSGSKGLQLYSPVRDERTSEQTSGEMKALAERLEKEQPELVVSRMTKAIRPGKVLLDWSQNNSAKTTVSVYSLRARPEHTVSTPVTWDEVEACSAPEDLVFRSEDVLSRIEEHGDLFAPLL